MMLTLLYVTFPDESVCRRISAHLVEHKLAACVVQWPATSTYIWDAALQNDSEWIGLFKTTAERADEAQKAIENMHPYEVPCIIRLPVAADAAYAKWVAQSTTI
jgi:periplasmic divalent cation tolerance protein